MDACIKIERMLFLQNVRKSVELIPNSNERNKNNYEKILGLMRLICKLRHLCDVEKKTKSQQFAATPVTSM